MEINEQLFEDVLAGKLKGTFVLRNGQKINSKNLCKSDWGKFCYRFANKPYVFTCNGYINSEDIPYEQDIINFIPDTNMKENELTIEIPEGKEIDWKESERQNKIVLKDKQLTYEDICKYLKNDFYFIRSNGGIGFVLGACNQTPNCAKTKHQLECILAKNQLANVAVYLNNGWEPSDTSKVLYNTYVIYITPKEDIDIVKVGSSSQTSNVIFKSKELAQQAIEILGEDTIKLALEPLGI